MIIKNIEIISFGKFKNKTIDFSDGLNIICGNNESGKSTVMNFIYAMLYGFGDNRGKSASLREKYTPWDGGECEGKLTAILPDGKNITIYRKAGVAKKHDTLRIYDADTGKELSLSPEEIVGVGSDTFLKTLFIRQMSTIFTGTNDEIVQRLSNISVGGDENINFEKAVKILEGARREIQPLRGAGGFLPQISAQISELEHKRTLQEAMQKELENSRSLLHNTRQYANDAQAKYEEALTKDFTADIAHLCGRIEEKELLLNATLTEQNKSIHKNKFALAGIILSLTGVVCLFVNTLFCIFAFLLSAFCFSAKFFIKEAAKDTTIQTEEINSLKAELAKLEERKNQHEKTLEALKENAKTAQERLNSLNVKIKSLTMGLSQDTTDTLDALYEKKQALQKRLRALTFASSALSTAQEKMQRNFTPALNKKASEFFSTITEGKYSRIFSDEQFNLTIDMDIPRKSELFSGGTIDQLYLSLRLALVDMLFEDTPSCIILDQPFLQYDTTRQKNTVKLLENMTNNRQILLFTSNSEAFSNNKKIELLT